MNLFSSDHLTRMMMQPQNDCYEFSLLSRITNELRTKMSQKRLKALSLMAIENDLTNALDLDDIVEDFARNSARKKCIS